MITPNLKEAIEMSGVPEDIVKMGRSIVSSLKCNAFITRGAEGISVFSKSGVHTHIPQRKINRLFDVTGAGDTVVAVSALGLASGLDLTETARLANYAGGIKVQKPGTATVRSEEMRTMFQEEIDHYIRESIEVKEKTLANQQDMIDRAAALLVEVYSKGNKVIAFGNGGSAADAQHFVAELVGRFKMERRALPAMALTTDSSIMTAIANDYGYERIFERQVEANAGKDDLVVGISTSGNSPNVVLAIEKAKELGCRTIGLTGRDGGELSKLCDVAVVVPSDNTPRIQEAHIMVIHIMCEILEGHLQKL